MAKYSQEFKLKVVEHYLSGHGDSVTGQLFNVHRSDVQKWSKAFKLYGLDFLFRSGLDVHLECELKSLLGQWGNVALVPSSVAFSH